MTFEVAAEAYGRFMGRYSEPLAAQFALLADLRPGDRALDVGCGPGALTARLVAQLGEDAVSAIDPSSSFVQALRTRFPSVDVQVGVAEQLPFPDDSVAAALAQLVVHFMTDPVAGLAQMRRVTRPGGVVPDAGRDHSAGGSGPLTTFWQAVHDITPEAEDEAGLAGTAEGELARLCEAAGLGQIESTRLTVTVPYDSFSDWWEPYTLGVGPAGAHVARLDEAGRDALRDRCAQLLPPGRFEVAASAWAVRARA